MAVAIFVGVSTGVARIVPLLCETQRSACRRAVASTTRLACDDDESKSSRSIVLAVRERPQKPCASGGLSTPLGAAPSIRMVPKAYISPVDILQTRTGPGPSLHNPTFSPQKANKSNTGRGAPPYVRPSTPLLALSLTTPTDPLSTLHRRPRGDGGEMVESKEDTAPPGDFGLYNGAPGESPNWP